MSSTVGAGSDDDEGGVWMASSEEDEEGIFTSSLDDKACFLFGRRIFLRDKQLGIVFLVEFDGLGDRVWIASSSEEEGSFTSEEEEASFSLSPFDDKACFVFGTRIFFREKQLGIVVVVEFDGVWD